MNDDVREVMWTALHRDWARLMLTPGDAIEAVLAALADVGYVTIKRDRVERLQYEASAHQGCRAVRGYLGPSGLQPGDLDPLPERGE